MGQQNTDAIQHLVDEFINTFRNQELAVIINDIDEEASGKGYSEILRTGPFTDSIIVWDSPSKNFKRTETVFNRTGVFITSVVRSFYSEDGSSVVATVTATITRTGNNFVNTVNVTVTRP